MSQMMDLAQKLMDTAAGAQHRKRECRDIRKSVMSIHKSFRQIANFKELKKAVMGPVTESHMTLNKAQVIIDQYGGKAEEGWVEKKFLPKDKFEVKYRNLMKELSECDKRLACAIKVVKDALKAGTITDTAEEPAGTELTEEALKAFELVTKEVPRLVRSNTLVQEAMDELDAEFPDAVSEVDPADMAPSETGEDTAMQDMLAAERGTGRQAVKGDTILGAAFVGDFWKVIEFWGVLGDFDDAGPLNETGKTYGPLHQAVFWESLEGVVLLTSRGADPNVLTARECPVLKVPADSTPLHLAATIGNAIIVKQLLGDGANPDLIDANGAKPIDVAGTAACRAALEDAADMRERMESFAEMIEDGERWDEALQMIKGADGLPANVMLPPGATEQSEKYHPIQKAAIQGNIAAYAKLVYAGALPIQMKGGDYELPTEGPAAEPSSLCEDEDVKPLFEMIEAACKVTGPGDGLPTVDEG